jgi:hypothetical protein
MYICDYCFGNKGKFWHFRLNYVHHRRYNEHIFEVLTAVDIRTVQIQKYSAAGSVGSVKFQLYPMFHLRFTILFVSVSFSEHLLCVTFCCSAVIPLSLKNFFIRNYFCFRQLPLEKHEHSGSV